MALTYTKAINNGKLSTSKMGIGESVTGNIVDVKEGKYGAIYVMEVNGKNVDILPSGNLKFLASDLESGKKSLNTFTTITRVADKTIKGYPVTQYTIVQGQTQTTDVASVSSPATNVADKLAAIRAKRTANGTNSSNS